METFLKLKPIAKYLYNFGQVTNKTEINQKKLIFEA